MPRSRSRSTLRAALMGLAVLTGCAQSASSPSSPPASTASRTPAPSAAASATTSQAGSLVIVGRIVTMDEPAVVEALLIETES